MSINPDFMPPPARVNVVHLHDPETHNTVCELDEIAPVISTTDVESVNCTECLTEWFGVGPHDDE